MAYDEMMLWTAKSDLIGSAFLIANFAHFDQKRQWSGMPGRALVGLPTDGVTYSKVNPGNHANYDIFVKSNSVNRKLVRGTTLLVKV